MENNEHVLLHHNVSVPLANTVGIGGVQWCQRVAGREIFVKNAKVFRLYCAVQKLPTSATECSLEPTLMT